MRVERESLDWATRGAAYGLDSVLGLQGKLLDAQARSESVDRDTVLARVDAIREMVARTHSTLVDMGGNSPLGEGAASWQTEPLRLNLLDEQGTSDTRELIALLIQAQAVAERVDAARGLALPADVPLLAGESRGTDLARSVHELVLRLRHVVEEAEGD